MSASKDGGGRNAPAEEMSPFRRWAEGILPMVIRAAWLQHPKLHEQNKSLVLIAAARGSILAPFFDDDHRKAVDDGAPPGAQTIYIKSLKADFVLRALRLAGEKKPEAAAALEEQAKRVEGFLSTVKGRDVIVLLSLSRHTGECLVEWPAAPEPKADPVVGDPRVNARGGSA